MLATSKAVVDGEDQLKFSDVVEESCKYAVLGKEFGWIVTYFSGALTWAFLS